MSGPLFDAPAFALEVRLAMARENVSYRGLQELIGVDQANIHRCAKKELPPSIETYLRLKRWLDDLDEREFAYVCEREQAENEDARASTDPTT